MVSDEVDSRRDPDAVNFKKQGCIDKPNVLFVGAHRTRGGGYSDLECRIKNLEVATAGLVLVDAGQDVREAATALVEDPISISTGVNSDSIAVRIRRTLHAVYRLWDVVRSRDVDVISTNGYKAGLLASIVSLLSSTGLVVRVHAKRFYKSYPVSSRFITRVADSVMHVSEYTAASAWPWERSVVVRSPIETDGSLSGGDGASIRTEFDLGDAPLLGLIGRIEPVKGHRYLLDVIPSLEEAVGDVRVLVVGDTEATDSEYVEGLRETVAENGLEDTVVFTGFREDIPDILAALDVLVVTSEEENVPKVVQEALLAETPVVAHDVGGISELVTAETGWLVPPGDRTALRDAVDSALSDSRETEAKATRGRRVVVDKHSISTVISQEERVYRRLWKDEQ